MVALLIASLSAGSSGSHGTQPEDGEDLYSSSLMDVPSLSDVCISKLGY